MIVLVKDMIKVGRNAEGDVFIRFNGTVEIPSLGFLEIKDLTIPISDARAKSLGKELVKLTK